MGLFDKIKEPIFLKENTTADETLEKLNILHKNAPKEAKQLIEQDIRAIKAGIMGEKNVAYELRNSHIPMYVLHDIYFTKGDLTAQIDYLLVTRGCTFVVECKNLYGNIEINSNGDFIRTVSYNGKNKKEGVYSPITQNARHLELIKEIMSEAQINAFTRAIFEKFFYINNRSVVVLANPKTVLNSKYAKKEVKEKVIRADQLIEFIKKVNAEKDIAMSSENQMEKLAQFFLKKSVKNPVDYTEKYRVIIDDTNDQIRIDNESNKSINIEKIVADTNIEDNEKIVLCPKCGAEMVRRKATRGTNAGNEFYGCSKYPKCHSIVNIKQ